MPDGPATPSSPLPWLSASTAAAMRLAWLAHGAAMDWDRAEAAAWDVAFARHPALPLTLIAEAVALVTALGEMPPAPC